jgi:hypothetical protein
MQILTISFTWSHFYEVDIFAPIFPIQQLRLREVQIPQVVSDRVGKQCLGLSTLSFSTFHCLGVVEGEGGMGKMHFST